MQNISLKILFSDPSSQSIISLRTEKSPIAELYNQIRPAQLSQLNKLNQHSNRAMIDNPERFDDRFSRWRSIPSGDKPTLLASIFSRWRTKHTTKTRKVMRNNQLFIRLHESIAQAIDKVFPVRDTQKCFATARITAHPLGRLRNRGSWSFLRFAIMKCPAARASVGSS